MEQAAHDILAVLPTVALVLAVWCIVSVPVGIFIGTVIARNNRAAERLDDLMRRRIEREDQEGLGG